ncbi:MAG: sulfurtransferase TusA family protein [Candidatus Limnocylindria bacterium]
MALSIDGRTRLPDGSHAADVAGPHEDRSVAAERLVEAIAARAFETIAGALAADARLRYLIPSGPGDIVGAAAVAAKFLQWFGDSDGLTVQSFRVEPVGDRISARYRFRVRNHDGWALIEQQLYLDVDDDGRIAAIDLVCSGFRPAGGPEAVRSSNTHAFDAGTMGCANGLASEFRRRIGAIPVGDVLVVTARDPAAKEDLPPLARLMGHTVRSVEASGDGRLEITVERGR